MASAWLFITGSSLFQIRDTVAPGLIASHCNDRTRTTGMPSATTVGTFCPSTERGHFWVHTTPLFATGFYLFVRWARLASFAMIDVNSGSEPCPALAFLQLATDLTDAPGIPNANRAVLAAVMLVAGSHLFIIRTRLASILVDLKHCPLPSLYTSTARYRASRPITPAVQVAINWAIVIVAHPCFFEVWTIVTILGLCCSTMLKQAIG